MQDTTHINLPTPAQVVQPLSVPATVHPDTVVRPRTDTVRSAPVRAQATQPAPVKQDTGSVRTDTSTTLAHGDIDLEVDSLFKFMDILSAPKLLTDSQAPAVMYPLFGTHQLQPGNMVPRSMSKLYPDWVFFIILLLLVLFTWIKVFYQKNIVQIGQAFVSMTVTNQIVRDENILVQRASILLTILFNISAALFLFQLSTYFDWNFLFIAEGLLRFMVFALLISVVYTIKFLILKVVGFLFDSDRPIANYIFNIFLINNMLGIGLSVMVTLMFLLPRQWFPYLVLFSILLISFSYIYRLMRGLTIGLNSFSMSKFYLFLYLCALELAPLLVFIKLVRG